MRERGRNSTHWACLFTKHKTQKRKVWNDGRLVLTSSRAELYNADPPPGSGDPILGECEITPNQLQTILMRHQHQHDTTTNVNSPQTTTLEMERYLIEVERSWTESSSSLSHAPVDRRRTTVVSSSMNKLMTSKFKKPKAYVPPQVRPDRTELILGKRQRPLQPGELVELHHGGGGGGGDGDGDVGYPPRQRNHDTHQYQQRQYRHEYQHRCDGQSSTPHHDNHHHHPFSQTSTKHKEPYSSRLQEQLLPSQHEYQHNHQQRQQPPPDGQSAGRKKTLLVGANDAMRPAHPIQRPCLDQPQKTHIHSGKSNNDNFARNEFDAASFYGLDEEEEDEENMVSQPLHYESKDLDITETKKQHKNGGTDEIGIDQSNRRRRNQRDSHDDKYEQQEQDHHYRQMQEQQQIQQQQQIQTNEVRDAQQRQRENEKGELFCRDGGGRKLEEVEEEENPIDNVAPLSFCLMPVNPVDDITSSSSSGNRLLELFGAVPSPSLESPTNPENNNNSSRGCNNKDSDKENSVLVRADGEDDSITYEGNKHSNDNGDDNTIGTKKLELAQPNEGIHCNNNKEEDGMSSGFYLAPAATSSEESSDDDDGDDEEE